MSISPAKINYKIYQGSTFKETFRWEAQTKGYTNITNISKTAPCVITTSNTHTIPQGWRFRVTDVLGMTQINQTSEDNFYLASSVTNNTITINSINSTNFNNYNGGGVISYNLPVPLAGFTGILQIRENISSPTTILQLTSAAGGGMIINDTNKFISITIPAITTAEFNFNSAIYGIELTSSLGEVFPLIIGNITVIKEVVR